MRQDRATHADTQQAGRGRVEAYTIISCKEEMNVITIIEIKIIYG